MKFKPGTVIRNTVSDLLYYVHYNIDAPDTFTVEEMARILKRGYIQGIDVHPSFWKTLIGHDPTEFDVVMDTRVYEEVIDPGSYLDNPQAYHKTGQLWVSLVPGGKNIFTALNIIKMPLVWGQGTTLYTSPQNTEIPRMALHLDPADLSLTEDGNSALITWEPYGGQYLGPYLTWMIEDDRLYGATVHMMGRNGMLTACGEVRARRNSSTKQWYTSISTVLLNGNPTEIAYKLQAISRMVTLGQDLEKMVSPEKVR